MKTGKDQPAIATDTRERFMQTLRRKLAERGYSDVELEAKLDQITSKGDISFNID